MVHKISDSLCGVLHLPARGQGVLLDHPATGERGGSEHGPRPEEGESGGVALCWVGGGGGLPGAKETAQEVAVAVSDLRDGENIFGGRPVVAETFFKCETRRHLVLDDLPLFHVSLFRFYIEDTSILV